MKSYKPPKVPENIKPIFDEVCNVLTELCQSKLNEEYLHTSIELLAKLARKRPSPLLAGKVNTWAAGIIHAIGLVNFLFDKTQTPHMTSADLCAWFRLGQSTVNSKSKSIRDMFRMTQLDPKWCLPSRLEDHPVAWLVSIDNYIIDVRYADLDIQHAAYEAGAIPYLPGSKTKSK